MIKCDNLSEKGTDIDELDEDVKKDYVAGFREHFNGILVFYL